MSMLLHACMRTQRDRDRRTDRQAGRQTVRYVHKVSDNLIIYIHEATRYMSAISGLVFKKARLYIGLFSKQDQEREHVYQVVCVDIPSI